MLVIEYISSSSDLFCKITLIKPILSLIYISVVVCEDFVFVGEKNLHFLFCIMDLDASEYTLEAELTNYPRKRKANPNSWKCVINKKEKKKNRN